MRILVADNEPDVAALLARVLTINGHHPVTVSDGAQAVEHVSRGHWDVLLLGPGLGGIATSHVTTYARRRAGSDVRIIWVELSPDADARITAFRAGADCVLERPMVVAELLAAVEAPVHGPATPADPAIG